MELRDKVNIRKEHGGAVAKNLFILRKST